MGSALRGDPRFLEGLPYRPYCGNVLADGIAQRPRAVAVGFSHVQYNREAVKRYLLFDIDHADAYYAYGRAGLPAPNLAMVNPRNGHGHYAYELAAPVTLYERSRLAPQGLLRIVERAYCDALQADVRYAAFLAKTAFHSDWETVAHREPYDLRELAARVDLDAAVRKVRRGEPEMGVGRNCTIFDQLRKIAYSEVRRFNGNAALSDFHVRLTDIAIELNMNPEFVAPLHRKEVAGIARSVAKWTWRRFSNEAFIALQKKLSQRANEKRWAGHVTAAERAAAAGVSRATLYRMEKKLKGQGGQS